MELFGIHWVDLAVLALYFAVVLYLGVFLGARKTKTLGDFFVAGGKWGPLVSFLFVFASAIAGNEAVVVSGQSYRGGISGVWFWWSFLFATPIYYLIVIKDYVKLATSLLSFLGIPIYFAVVWRRANTTGMWWALGLGSLTYLAVMWRTSSGGALLGSDDYFVPAVFLSTAAALLGMWLGSLLGRPEADLKLKRFYLLLATPIGQEARLVEAGIRVPSLVDAGLVGEGPEQLDAAALERHYAECARDKIRGPASTLELRREPTLPWYLPGFVRITLACVALVAGTWLLTRFLFVWGGS